ncbi:hypothetical protein QOT17_019803 [Balamuthia mandrillaris]
MYGRKSATQSAFSECAMSFCRRGQSPGETKKDSVTWYNTKQKTVMPETIIVTYCQTPEGYFVGTIRGTKGYTSDEGLTREELEHNLRGGLAALDYELDEYELVWIHDPTRFDNLDLLFEEVPNTTTTPHVPQQNTTIEDFSCLVEAH